MHSDRADHQAAGSAQLTRALRARGISPTRQRLEIARVLFARDQHVSAERLLELVRMEGRVAVSKATVYNTLKLFARTGLVREVIVDPSRIFYDSNTSAHHHLYDTSSGELTDIAADSVHLAALPELPEGAQVEGVDVVVRVRMARR